MWHSGSQYADGHVLLIASALIDRKCPIGRLGDHYIDRLDACEDVFRQTDPILRGLLALLADCGVSFQCPARKWTSHKKQRAVPGVGKDSVQTPFTAATPGSMWEV